MAASERVHIFIFWSIYVSNTCPFNLTASILNTVVLFILFIYLQCFTELAQLLICYIYGQIVYIYILLIVYVMC